MRRRGFVAGALAALAVPARAQSTRFATRRHRIQIATVAEGLRNPWGLAILPDGRLMVSERGGRLSLIENGRPHAVADVPAVFASREAGLLDLCLAPDFAASRRIYLSYVAPGSGGVHVRVARHRLDGGRLTDAQMLLDIPGGGDRHFGCRLRFAPDATLFVTTGERGSPPRAQDLNDLNGKILRVTADGAPAPGNPFLDQPAARGEIFALGIRNSQGVAFADDGRVWACDHGPTVYDGPAGGDEINLIEAGRNYGWPLISHRARRAGLESPVAEFTPAIAPSGCAIYRGSAFGEWRGNLLVACLRGRRLQRCIIDGARIVEQESMLEGSLGRLRHVVEAPDGRLYILIDADPGRIVVLEPA